MDDPKNGMGDMDDPKNVVPPIFCGYRYKALRMGRRGGDGWVTTPLYLYTAFRETGFHTVFNTPS